MFHNKISAAVHLIAPVVDHSEPKVAGSDTAAQGDVLPITAGLVGTNSLVDHLPGLAIIRRDLDSVVPEITKIRKVVTNKI